MYQKLLLKRAKCLIISKIVKSYLKMAGESSVFQWILFLRQMLVSSIGWSVYFMFGLILGSPTVIIPQLRTAANSTAAVSDEMASWISSVFGYVGIIWVFIMTISAHRYGLKKTLMIQIINAFIAYTVLFFSQDATTVLISQMLHGPTAASQTSTILLVLTEYSSPRYRGFFLTIKSATCFWGIWIANAVGLYFPYKYIGIIGIICTIYTFIIVLIIPESPYWLAKEKRYEECAKSHRWVKGVDSVAEKELEDLIATQKSYDSCDKAKNTLTQYVRNRASEIVQPEMYKPILLICLLYSMYHMSGKMVLTVYSIDIIKKITNSQSTAHVGMLILDGITVLGMYTGCGIARILNRRSLIVGASSLATTFLYIMAAYLFLIRFAVIKENGYVSIGLLMGFSLSIAWGPMIMATSIAGELLPVRSRIFCMGVISIFTKMLTGTILKISPYILKSFQTHGSFLFFGISSTVLLAIAYKFLPETKDKTLHEIANYFKKEVKAPESELVSLTKPSAN